MTIAEMSSDQRAKRLRAASASMHARVDHAIMAARPFASRENYARFLRFQYRLHCRVEPLYVEPAFQPLLPDLAARSRLIEVTRDFSDLGQTLPELPEAAPRLPLPEALGWLYVVEGSNMGAAFLLKAAGDLGLSEDFGARHLAGHAQGRGLHWRRFTTALDAVELSQSEDERAQSAASTAFAYVLDLVALELPTNA